MAAVNDRGPVVTGADLGDARRRNVPGTPQTVAVVPEPDDKKKVKKVSTNCLYLHFLGCPYHHWQ